MPKQIFLSYARQDRPLVQQLSGDLHKSGFDPFLDEELAGGQSWWDELMTRIEQCDVFMPALSMRYLKSTPCSHEASYATALGKPFLPVTLELEVPVRLCPPSVAESQWVPYDPAGRDAILGLIRGLNAMPSAGPLPSPMPARPEVPISYLTALKDKVDQPTDLTRDDQLMLLSQLRPRLGGDEDADVMVLIRSFAARGDLYQQVATDLQVLVADHTPAAAAQRAPMAAPPPSPRPPTYTSPQQHQPPPPYQNPPQPQQQAQPHYQVPPQPPHQPQPQGQPGYGYATSGPAPTKPPSYLVWAILAVLACWPVAGISIYFAAQVDRKYGLGDYAGAESASKQAKTFLIITVVLAVLFWGVMMSLALDSSNTTGNNGF